MGRRGEDATKKRNGGNGSPGGSGGNGGQGGKGGSGGDGGDLTVCTAYGIFLVSKLVLRFWYMRKIWTL